MSNVHEHCLSNGMTLLCNRQSHLHSVCFGLYLKGGALYETAQTQGICHLLEHLCFRRLGEMDHEQLSLAQSRMGAELEGATYPEGVVFVMEALPRFFTDLLRFFRRFFADTVWTEEDVAREKQVVLRQIEQTEYDFDDQLQYRYRRTPNGAFPVMGTAESITAMPESAIRLWQRMLFQPQNACLCISGSFTKGMEAAAIAVMSEIKNYTETAPFRQTIPRDFCMRDAHSDYVQNEEGGQARVHLAFDIDGEQVYPLQAQVLSAFIGGAQDSLLFQTLREEEALVAEIESYVEETGEFRRLIIQYDVRQQRLKESLKRVADLLVRIKMYIRPVRLMLSRLQFTDNLQMAQDSAAGMNELMGWSWIAGDVSQCDLEALSQMYDDLTVEDLLDAAQAVLRPENLTVSVRKDPDMVEDDLTNNLRELRKLLE